MTVSRDTLRSISTPDKLESRLGTLEFVNGVPRRAGGQARSNPTTPAPTNPTPRPDTDPPNQAKEDSRESRAARYPNIKPGQEFTGYACF